MFYCLTCAFFYYHHIHKKDGLGTEAAWMIFSLEIKIFEFFKQEKQKWLLLLFSLGISY